MRQSHSLLGISYCVGALGLTIPYVYLAAAVADMCYAELLW